MNILQPPSTSFPRPTKRKLNTFEQLSLETMQKVGKKIDSYKEDDSFDRFGKHVADRLRDVKPHQVKIAQKLISDVLFEADMESLNRYWKITGPDVEQYQHSGFQPFTSYRQVQTQPNPPFTPEQAFSPGQSSYTSENSVKEYINSFNPNQK